MTRSYISTNWQWSFDDDDEEDVDEDDKDNDENSNDDEEEEEKDDDDNDDNVKKWCDVWYVLQICCRKFSSAVKCWIQTHVLKYYDEDDNDDDDYAVNNDDDENICDFSLHPVSHSLFCGSHLHFSPQYFQFEEF